MALLKKQILELQHGRQSPSLPQQPNSGGFPRPPIGVPMMNPASPTFPVQADPQVIAQHQHRIAELEALLQQRVTIILRYLGTIGITDR